MSKKYRGPKQSFDIEAQVVEGSRWFRVCQVHFPDCPESHLEFYQKKYPKWKFRKVKQDR